MVDAIANRSLEILGDLLVEETEFLLGVSGQVENVKRDLRRIHGMLRKADRKRSNYPTLNLYMNELKNLAFEAETVLETYAVKVESKREAGRSLKQKLQKYICIMSECSAIHEVGRQTGDITSRLSNLTTRLQTEIFGQQIPPPSSHEEDELRKTNAHEVEPHFVGMESDIELLVSKLRVDLRASKRVVIKIYGMGGLGKTTLARKIYNHRDVAPYARAWVCVTQHFKQKAVLSTILKRLENNDDRNEEIDGKGLGDLEDGIHSFAEQRKCLIVIDDIWENEHWDIIKQALPLNCNVLLTTRNENIANEESHSHKLRFLTENEGWDLLRKIAPSQISSTCRFLRILLENPEGEISEEINMRNATPGEAPSANTTVAAIELLEGIGRKIVVKCGLLPLSISVIGGILRQKEEDDNLEAEWEKVYAKLDTYLSKGEGVEENKRVKQVLELSYEALPYYLKPCFLYLASFPEDEEFDTERLYLLWMAEGFVSHQDRGPTETLRDVAERYLAELGMRCMVQVHKTKASPYKKFDSCELHDLMHELCSSKAEEENLLKRIEISTYLNDIPIGDFISRLAIILEVNDNCIPGLEEVDNLRSFMLRMKVTYPNTRRMVFGDSRINLEKSPRLRVLVLENCEFEGGKLPREVRKLIHLRYLSLRFSCVKRLPKFVCGMSYLQTLDLQLSYSGARLRLPNKIWKMKKLKHLFLPTEIEVIGGGKLRLDGLNALETLQHVESKKVRITDIRKLKSLRKLSVTVDGGDSMSIVLKLMNDNKNRPCETMLFVDSCDLSSETGRDVFKDVLLSPSSVMLHITRCNLSYGFPCYELGMCNSLVHMELDGCKVGAEVDVMQELGNYPTLQSLSLNQVDFSGTETLICPSNSFPKLDFLILKDLPHLKKWEVNERTMPKLSKLWINRCISMEKVPDGLRFISTLRKLDVTGMPEEFNERVRVQDFDIVSHIPSITIE